MREGRGGMAQRQRTYAGGVVDAHLEHMHAGRSRGQVLHTSTGAFRGFTAIGCAMFRVGARLGYIGRGDLKISLGVAHTRPVLMASGFG